ncbi:hypothetical protein FE697_016185 [Mumia zhuanghuii]|uniref:IPT/TIG domain-containing protein n=2 Tax=Mumia TaxID=1546255 RepID=A0ABW1QR57_9ACTN|nr:MULTISPECIES: hypothetical protein [Mumia]KAA1420497.1 hypothetical protein FE697_016185 [Mumia zhuanghuii]
MRAGKSAAVVALIALLGVYVGAWSSAAAVPAADAKPGLSATVTPGEGRPGANVEVKGAGWPPLTQVQAVVCGDLAIGGSGACDQSAAALAVSNVDGELDIDLVVGNPPRPCPCVVRVASYTGPALAVDAPFVVTGHAVGTPPSVVTPQPDLVVTDVRLVGGGGLAGLFGAAPARKLVVEVENQGTAPAYNPEILIGVGRSDLQKPDVALTRDITVLPLQSTTIESKIELPFAAFGTYHVVGSIGEGPSGTQFETTWGAYPWGLVAINLLALLLLAWAVRRRIAARKARPQLAEAEKAALASPYPLPDVVYVDALGGFLVSPKAVGRSGLIKRLDGRLEQRDLETLLHDPAAAGVIATAGAAAGARGGSSGDGASVVDLLALESWLRRRHPGAAPEHNGGGDGSPTAPDSVVDVDAVDTWLDRRDKRSSQST